IYEGRGVLEMIMAVYTSHLWREGRVPPQGASASAGVAGGRCQTLWLRWSHGERSRAAVTSVGRADGATAGHSAPGTWPPSGGVATCFCDVTCCATSGLTRDLATGPLWKGLCFLQKPTKST